MRHAVWRGILSFPGMHLLGRSWFVGNSPSVANIANYVYAGLIHERGANEHEFSSLLAWMGRIEGIGRVCRNGDVTGTGVLRLAGPSGRTAGLGAKGEKSEHMCI